MTIIEYRFFAFAGLADQVFLDDVGKTANGAEQIV